MAFGKRGRDYGRRASVRPEQLPPEVGRPDEESPGYAMGQFIGALILGALMVAAFTHFGELLAIAVLLVPLSLCLWLMRLCLQR